MKFFNFREQASIYREYAKNIDSNRVKTGLTPLDEAIYGIAKGEVFTLIAYSGTYKSCLSQNILMNIANNDYGDKCLFYSLEMPIERVFSRSIQMTCNYTTRQVEQEFKENDLFQEIVDKAGYEGGAENLIVCPSSGLSLKDVAKGIEQVRAQYGHLSCVAIDYMGLVKVEGKQDEYSRISYVAENAKELAKYCEIPVIILAQVNRASLHEGKITKHSGKGSGSVEASADYLVGLELDREGELVMRLLKNRNGKENLAWKVWIEKDYMRVRGLLEYTEPTTTYNGVKF